MKTTKVHKRFVLGLEPWSGVWRMKMEKWGNKVGYEEEEEEEWAWKVEL